LLAAPLAEYRCLHLATHGSSVLAGDARDDPLACGIALRDGMLDGLALASLDLHAELVVLAACHSGQRALGGRGLAQLPGDDLFGLQGVLFGAGVNALLGALWPVDDDSARAILVDFHRAYAGGAAPELALQRALKAHLAAPERRHTLYDWAPFFLSVLGGA
jgi:CHAT domain-containing protein